MTTRRTVLRVISGSPTYLAGEVVDVAGWKNAALLEAAGYLGPVYEEPAAEREPADPSDQGDPASPAPEAPARRRRTTKEE